MVCPFSMLIRVRTFISAPWSGCRTADESAGKSGDVSVAYIIGKDDESIIIGRRTILYRRESLCSIVFWDG